MTTSTTSSNGIMDNRASPGRGAAQGAELTTPTKRGFYARTLDDTLGRFDAPWSSPSTPSRARGRVPAESTFANMLSSPARGSRSDEPTSSTSRMEEEDLLNVEKSRILEQLRLMTTEVDQLESRLQAVKRRRARAVASALQKHQQSQESEAQEMRHILGTVHHLTIPDSAKVDRRTMNTPLSAQAVSAIDTDMIRRLEGFTNIAFTSIENRILSTSETDMKERRYRIAGVCFHLEFEVEFTVHEPHLDLSEIFIGLPRSAQAELGQFAARAQTKSLLMPFFQTFTQYAQMDHDRQSLMKNLANRFPKLVKTNHSIDRLLKAPRLGSGARNRGALFYGSPAGPGVQSLTFCGPKKTSPELVFRWAIDVTDQGALIPHARLLPRMPKKWRQADEKATLDAIPTQFVRLLQLKGTEGAVAAMLQCIYGRLAVEAMESV